MLIPQVKYFVHLVLFLVLTLFASAPALARLDAPHNATSGIGCITCHQMTSNDILRGHG